MAAVKSKNIVWVLFIGFILRFIIIIISSWHPDLNNHLDWGIRFLNLGPKKFYENIFWGVSWPNQPYGTMLLFAVADWLNNAIFNIFLFLNNTISVFPSFIIPILESHLHVWLVKLPFILSDLGISFLIYKIIKVYRPSQALLAASLFLFNPVIIYNSAVWGQTDSFINLLALCGLYLTYEKRYFWGIIFFLSSFLFKLSLIIYVPIFCLFLFKRMGDFKNFIVPVLIFFIFMTLLAIPFTFGDKNPWQWIWYMYTNRVLVRQGSMLNGNAFNFWFFIFGIDFSKSEFNKFGLLTYQTWGRLLYILFIIPVYFKFLKSKPNLYNLFFGLMLTAFGAFIFLTNMHERYLYPILPIITILIFLPKSIFNIKSLLILSLFHLINLYNLWFYPLITPLKEILIFSNFIICRILSFILMSICLYFLVRYLKSENQ